MDLEPQPALSPVDGPERRQLRPGAIAGGVILLALGAAMLLDTTGTIDIHIGRLIAPIVLIAIGMAMMLDKGGVVYGRRERTAAGEVRMRTRRRGSPGAGVWLIGIGSWMIASQTHLFGLDYGNSWPLFIILAGLM